MNAKKKHCAPQRCAALLLATLMLFSVSAPALAEASDASSEASYSAESSAPVAEEGTSSGVEVAPQPAGGEIRLGSGMASFAIQTYAAQKVPVYSGTTKNVKVNLFDYDTNKFNTAANIPLKFNSGGGGGINQWTGSGGGAYQGILKTKLSGGMPTLATGQSLSAVFGTGAVDGKTTYTNVDFPFRYDADGGYSYNSADNHAQLVKKGTKLTLYDATLGYSGRKEAGFWPFNDITNSSKNSGSGADYYVSAANFHFGMSMSIDFSMPLNGQIKDSNGVRKDMVYTFAGDDDMWVFIDDTLVLDIGGIHNATGGSINFATGEVKVGKVSHNAASYGTSTTLQKLFDLSGKTFKTGSTHVLRVFYLERGEGLSNCKMNFNLPVKEPGSIRLTKQTENANPAITASTVYQFQLYYKSATASQYVRYNGKYSVSGSAATKEKDTENGSMYLAAGETLTVNSDVIPVGSDYYFLEIPHQTDSHPHYTTTWTNGGAAESYQSPTYQSVEMGTEPVDVVCTNYYPTVEVPMQDLTLEKKWTGLAQTDANTVYSFKLEMWDDTLDQYVPYESVEGNGDTQFIQNGAAALKVGEALTLRNLPVATKYRITETTYDPAGQALSIPVYSTNNGQITDGMDGSMTGVIMNLSGAGDQNGINNVFCTNSRPPVEGEMLLQKQDDQRQALPGASFTVTAAGHPAQAVTTGSNGRIAFVVYEGSETYTLHETQAPEGFLPLEHDHTFRVTYDGATKRFSLGEITCAGQSESCGFVTDASFQENEVAKPMLNVRNQPIVGSVTVTKKIDKFYAPHGNPVFFFNLKNKATGVVYSRFVEFTQEAQAGYQEQGLTATFEDLPLGTYLLTEQNPIRYQFHALTVSGGAKNGQTATFTLTKDNLSPSAIYQNQKHYNFFFSHTDVASNEFTIQPKA